MSKEYFLECLADPFIFNSVAEFHFSIQDGEIIKSDGCGNLLFINKETLQLEKEENCFKDGLNIWKTLEDEENEKDCCKTIERIINHFSDDKRQLIGILWYNK